MSDDSSSLHDDALEAEPPGRRSTIPTPTTSPPSPTSTSRPRTPSGPQVEDTATADVADASRRSGAPRRRAPTTVPASGSSSTATPATRTR